MAQAPSDSLRSTLRKLADSYAKQYELDRFLSKGSGVVVFKPALERDGMSHGNFIEASYQQIVRNPDWGGKLKKSYGKGRNWFPPEETDVRELDSSNSSDALLMNIFCHPGMTREVIARLFGLQTAFVPQFAFRIDVHRIPVGRPSEIDMVLGSEMLVEAKLTEAGFTSVPVEKMKSYSRFAETFDAPLLRKGDSYKHYQLIRNVLAADQTNRRFTLLHDERRPDLRAAWEEVCTAIRDPGLKARCHRMTWQKVAAVCPSDLQRFLDEKYGIIVCP